MQRVVMLMTTLILFTTPCFADELSTLLQKQTMYQTQINAAQEALLELGLNHPVYTLTAVGTLASGVAAILNENLSPAVRVFAGIASYYGASYCYREWDQGCGAVSRELALIGTRMLTAQQTFSEVERQITALRGIKKAF